jgi:hypothetical protein
MHLKNLLSYGLLAGFSFTTTFAANPAADALTSISTKLDSLVKSLNAWNGDIVTVTDIMLQSEELLGVIDKAVDSVKGKAVMELKEAVTILKPANLVVKQTQQVIDGLIAKKPDLEKAKVTSVVKDILDKFHVSAGKLLAGISATLPDNVKAVGDNIGKQINTAIDKGLAAYA